MRTHFLRLCNFIGKVSVPGILSDYCRKSKVMPLKDRVSRWKGRIRGTEKPTGQLEQNPASDSKIISSQTSSNGPQTISNHSHTNSQPPISGKCQRNLWHEAFDKLPQNSKQELQSRGMNQKTAATIEEFRKEAEKVRDKSQEREWKVQIGSHELPVRQTAVQILDWANKIGDIAIQFAPSPGAGVWAVAKFLLGVSKVSSGQRITLKW